MASRTRPVTKRRFSAAPPHPSHVYKPAHEWAFPSRDFDGVNEREKEIVSPSEPPGAPDLLLGSREEEKAEDGESEIPSRRIELDDEDWLDSDASR